MILDELDREERKFGFVAILKHMNVQGLMVVRVEFKDKTEEYKYCWHGFFFAKIGNNLITSKSFSRLFTIFALRKESSV